MGSMKMGIKWAIEILRSIY